MGENRIYFVSLGTQRANSICELTLVIVYAFRKFMLTQRFVKIFRNLRYFTSHKSKSYIKIFYKITKEICHVLKICDF